MDCEFFLKQPSIFEIICEENLSNSIKAAIKKFIKVCFSFILFTHFNQKLLCKSVRMAQWMLRSKNWCWSSTQAGVSRKLALLAAHLQKNISENAWAATSSCEISVIHDGNLMNAPKSLKVCLFCRRTM